MKNCRLSPVFSLTRLMLLCLATCGLLSRAAHAADRYSEDIEPYVSFLKNQKESPVDYIMGLFEKHDLVILCERDHRETTQYDLIHDLVSDDRFIADVGHIFTELGTSSLRQEVHEFLFAEDLSNKEIEKRALAIYRDIEYAPTWDKYNFFDFLKRLYSLNNSLRTEQKIELHFSDVPFSWKGMTAEKYREFSATLDERDKTIATQIIDKFNEIRASDSGRKKALVILNSGHAFNDRFELVGQTPNVKLAGRYLFEAYPAKVANVMLNFMKHGGKMGLVHEGKWDAAFKVSGNRSLGFDFAASPFGRDAFDYISGGAKNLTYGDVFTGFVFYRPLEEFRIAIGVPGLTDDGYGEEIVARYAIAGRPLNEANAKAVISAFSRTGKVHRFTYRDKGIFGDPNQAAPLSEKETWLKRRR